MFFIYTFNFKKLSFTKKKNKIKKSSCHFNLTNFCEVTNYGVKQVSIKKKIRSLIFFDISNGLIYFLPNEITHCCYILIFSNGRSNDC